MREDFESTEKFQERLRGRRMGVVAYPAGVISQRGIDLSTLTEDACRTLAALYLMSLGDSVLLV